MKKQIVLAAFTLLGFAAIAQDHPNPPHPPRPEDRMKHVKEMLQKELKLTSDQQVKVEAAIAKFFESADKIRKDNPPPPPPPMDPKVKAAMDKLEKERDEAVKAVLSADQYEKYKKAAERMRPPMPGKERPGKE